MLAVALAARQGIHPGCAGHAPRRPHRRPCCSAAVTKRLAARRGGTRPLTTTRPKDHRHADTRHRRRPDEFPGPQRPARRHRHPVPLRLDDRPQRLRRHPIGAARRPVGAVRQRRADRAAGRRSPTGSPASARRACGSTTCSASTTSTSTATRPKALVYHTSHQVFEEDPTTVNVLVGRYHDVLMCTADGWRISRLVFEILWGERRQDATGTWPPSAGAARSSPATQTGRDDRHGARARRLPRPPHGRVGGDGRRHVVAVLRRTARDEPGVLQRRRPGLLGVHAPRAGARHLPAPGDLLQRVDHAVGARAGRTGSCRRRSTHLSTSSTARSSTPGSHRAP